MVRWLPLAGAIVVEVAATLALRAAQDHPAWYALVVTGYATAFALLGLALRRGMALGVAYGIWGATGVALTAGLAALLFGESLTVTMVIGIALIVVGVYLVETGSHRSGEPGPK